MPALKTPEQIEQHLKRVAGRGLLEAGKYLRNRILVKLSVPAPRRMVTAGPRSRLRPPGSRYWVATTPATPGAPPRKITGSLKRKVNLKEINALLVQVGVFADVRARPLETWMNHSYLAPTLQEERGNLMRIIGNEFSANRVV